VCRDRKETAPGICAGHNERDLLHRTILLDTLVLQFTVTVCSAETLPFPKPPPGYSWQKVPDMGGAFLKPASWHYKHVERKGQHACFITKEDIDAEGSFQTGLTVNMILLSHLKTGISASQYAQQFIRTATRERECVRRLKSAAGGGRSKPTSIRLGPEIHAADSSEYRFRGPPVTLSLPLPRATAEVIHAT